MSKSNEPTRDVFESRRRGLSHNSVRKANEKTVLTAVAFNAGSSNADISRLSGLAPQTVSAILVDLEQGGLVLRGPVLRGRRGQPATPILLNPDGALAIGVEIGWRHLDVVLLNLHAQVVRHHHAEYDLPDAGLVVDQIASAVATFSADLTSQQRDRLLDLGIAMPGEIVAGLELTGAPPEQVEAWRELDLVAELEARTGLAVATYNDGNAGCWAELIALRPPRPANIVYLLVSHFIAAGIVGDGALWEGPTGNAAELGSMLVSTKAGPPDVAHRLASVWALRDQLARSAHPAAMLPAGSIAPDQLAEAGPWLDTAAQALAEVIFNTHRVVEQPLVVIDTVLPISATTVLVEKVIAELSRLPVVAAQQPRVVAGRLGALAPAIGAAELPLFRRYF